MINYVPHYTEHYRSGAKKFETTLADIRRFVYGTHRHNADHTMLMTKNTPMFLAEACAASLTSAHAPVAGERRTNDAPALAGRYAT